jgi:hypothetical protein
LTKTQPDSLYACLEAAKREPVKEYNLGKMTNFRQQIELNRPFYPSTAALALIVLAFIWGYNCVVMKKVLKSKQGLWGSV